jgi:hypothetical protein
VRATLVLVGAALLGCTAVRDPALDPKEHVRGEHHRLLREPVEQVWGLVVAALEADGLRVVRRDPRQGVITTAPARYAERDVVRRLREIGDLSAVGGSRARVSELRVAYYLLVAPAGADTSLRIRSRIEAEERSHGLLLGPGIFQVIPHRFEVPSRGVVERELMRRLAANLFTAEEMLFLLGEPGVD